MHSFHVNTSSLIFLMFKLTGLTTCQPAAMPSSSSLLVSRSGAPPVSFHAPTRLRGTRAPSPLTDHAPQRPAHLQRQMAPRPHLGLPNRTIPERRRRAPLSKHRNLLPTAHGSTLRLRALGSRQRVAFALPKLAAARCLRTD